MSSAPILLNNGTTLILQSSIPTSTPSLPASPSISENASTTEICPAPLFSDEWLGSRIWEAATALINYLEDNLVSTIASELRPTHPLPPDRDRHARHETPQCHSISNVSVVELGGGTGMVSLALATMHLPQVHDTRNTLHFDILCTDMPNMVPLIQSNIDRNQAVLVHPCRADVLDWSWHTIPTSVMDHVDSMSSQGSDSVVVVLASDALNPIYGPTNCIDFVRTVSRLLVPSPSPLRDGRGVALVAQTQRGFGDTERELMHACEKYDLDIRREQSVKISSDIVDIYVIKQRK